MLLDIDTRRPLKFSRKAESPEGDEVTIRIKYDMLFKHCSTCGTLTHEKEYCPLFISQSRNNIGKMLGRLNHRFNTKNAPTARGMDNLKESMTQRFPVRITKSILIGSFDVGMTLIEATVIGARALVRVLMTVARR